MTLRQAVIPEDMRAVAADLAFSPAIRSGDLLFLTGMTGSAPDGSVSSDPETQFDRAFDKIATVLRAEGLTLDSVVEITSYHIDIRTHFDTFERVVRRRLHTVGPAWTAVGVAELRRVGALAEVRAIAQAPQHVPA